MKKVILVVSFVLVFQGLKAQTKNTLLQADFWKQSPGIEAVKAEIAKGNSPSEATSNAFDVTTIAINNNAPFETIKFLIDQPGNSVSKITHDSRIYLHWAAMRGNLELIQYLIAKGSDVNLQDNKGTEPLLFGLSAAAKNTAIFDAFVKGGVNLKAKYRNGASLLLLAIANDNDLSLTNYFISKGLSLKDTDEDGYTAFDYATKGGNITVLKSLIQKGVKPTNGALFFAAQSTGKGTSAPLPELYRYLLDELKLNPAVTNKSGENVLHSLVRKADQEDIISNFIARGVNVNQANAEGNTPFILAATGRNIAVLELLLPKVKNVNAANAKGETALTQAVRSSSSQMVSFLLAKGANVQVTDHAGKNLAYTLVENYRAPRGEDVADEFTEKMNILKAAGLDLSAPQKDGSSLYHAAISKSDIGLLQKLAGFKIDVNAKDKEGMTVLHKAALIARDDQILKYLISINADKTLKTDFDETAYNLAAENEFLKKKNISVNFLK